MQTTLNLPSYSFKFKELDQRTQIFDPIRKKYIFLTPEEWVRQNFIQYLIQEKQFPKSLIAVEMGLKYNKMQKRGDVVVYNKSGNPMVIIECKSTKVKIAQDTFDQIARYNMVLKVQYLVVTNGFNHYCCTMDYEKKSYLFINEIPNYCDL